MIKLIGRWLVTALPLVLGVSVLTFALTSFIPGDPARAVLGVNATEAQYAELRQAMGLDLPLYQQYWNWFSGVLHGDFGRSLSNSGSVATQLMTRFGVTMSLVVGAVLVASLVGLGLGIASALRSGALAKVVDVLSLGGLAVPSYWFGLVLAWIFAVNWELFPAGGYTPFSEDPGGWLKSLVLPVLTLGLTSSAGLAKQTRDSIKSELAKDYVMVLRARGIPERNIIFGHVLRNAGAPIVTVVGLLFIGLLSGTVLAETVFVLPGLGGLAVAATAANDVPVIQGIATLFTVIVVTVNLAIEIVYAALNPKVRS